MIAHRTSLKRPVFYIELHCEHPEKIVQFYAKMLSVKFALRAYPFTCYTANLGGTALVISAAKDRHIRAEAGSVTLGVLTAEKPRVDGERYFLPPKRPLGDAYPERYATRVKDPEGNYLALVSSMEDLMGRVPPVESFRELVDCAFEYGLVLVERVRNRARNRLADLINAWEYATDHVTCTERDLEGFSHLVASREGLYVVNPSTSKRIVRGEFFGATIKDNSIYCFQSCGSDQENKGRILKLAVNGNRVTSIEIIAKGLDDGCHQIEFIGGQLFVVDCYNGRILQIAPGVPGHISHYPLGHLSREEAKGQYHINSIAGHPDGTIWLLLHNKDRKPSEVLVVNRHFEVLRRFAVEAGGAHNIVFTDDDLEYLIADSSGARVICAHRTVTDTEMMRPRGISLDENICVVGDSFFATRPFRRFVPGRVHFFDRASWRCISSLSLPAAPTEIRRIDGRDFSISDYFAARTSSYQGKLV